MALPRPPVGEGVEVLFKPKGVAVIGASRKPGKVGYMVLYNLKNSYEGPIYPVNPNADEILGLKAYPTIMDVPDPVDLAVVTVPAKMVPDVVDQAGRRGVRAVIVISAGFREVGGEGVELEKRLLEVVRKHGIRMLGPNCLGVYSPSTGINATFLDPEKQGLPGKGPIAFISQSGALGAALLDWLDANQFGISKFISIGNKADIDEADLLAYLRKDPETKSIAMYIEGVAPGEGGRFRRALEETTHEKPVVILKSGRTAAGARAASSHTGSLAGSYQLYETIFKQTGVIPAYDTAQLFEMALALALQPPMLGDRVAIITMGGGSGVMASDNLAEKGLKVVELSPETQAKLRKVLLPIASPRNPVDVTGSATDEHFLESIRIVVESGEVDGIFLIPYLNLASITPELPRKIAALVKEIQQKYRIPFVASVTAGKKTWALAKIMEKEAGIPVYSNEASAARAMWALRQYGKWLQKIGVA
ncbi:acetate--CoA ligase family protein [Hyperthermus butylicus]|uniref:Universally conserved protein n=1 Tax=Hyperthermus butylicus (strain DSM 5456 / JCM 9403 / PLM1-5) TaxID=415426 RepID=A2BLI1_HYPBU|nr:CoA-binding protein [Hyperthermus butylicus]ABM80842.1 universally conserved protein [Hyperthermus butylicus DSM 5456]